MECLKLDNLVYPYAVVKVSGILALCFKNVYIFDFYFEKIIL